VVAQRDELVRRAQARLAVQDAVDERGELLADRRVVEGAGARAREDADEEVVVEGAEPALWAG